MEKIEICMLQIEQNQEVLASFTLYIPRFNPTTSPLRPKLTTKNTQISLTNN